MRVAVTGASGFIGGAVVHALRANGHDVRPYGRRATSALSRPVDGYAMWDIAAGAMPLDSDAVVHCAAAVGQWGPRSLYWRTNVHGTQHVVDSMHPSARLVYVSTASVYPPAWSDAPILETATDGAQPTCVYGRSKLAGEHVALQRSGSTIVLRPHIVYGRGDSTLWPRVAAARRRESLAVPGNGTNRVSVTHIDNLVDAVVAALQPEAAEGVYNVADEEAPTVDELLRTMFSRRDLPTTIRYVARESRGALRR
jgi:2-alkyl-3-oxoalkanoate reductase